MRPWRHEPLSWRWVAAGVLQGAVLLGGLAPVWDLNGRADIVGVFAALALLLTGTLLGYRSARGTLAEAAVGGGAIVVAAAAVVAALGRYPVPAAVLAGAVPVGWLVTLAGGWIGLVLRRAVLLREPADRSVAWSWVAVGVVLGVTLNGSAVFVVSAVVEAVGFHWSPALLAFTFAGSFVVTGLFVGYHAPGHTPRDAAVVALAVAGVDALLVTAVFRAAFPGLAVVAAGGIGLVLILLGGWVGDVAWQLRRSRGATPPSPGPARRSQGVP